MSEDLQHAQQRLRLDQIDGDIDALDGKAATDSERFALLALRVDALEGRLALASGGLEGKAIHGWAPEKEKDFERLMRRIGGFVEDGGPAGSVLDFDAQHFGRAQDLVTGVAAPDSDDERRALARWRAKHED